MYIFGGGWVDLTATKNFEKKEKVWRLERNKEVKIMKDKDILQIRVTKKDGFWKIIWSNMSVQKEIKISILGILLI